MRQWPVTDIVAKGLVQWPSDIRHWRLVQCLLWRLVTLIFKYLTPATVTGRQPLYETSATVRDSYKLHQSRLRDISHCTRFQPLYKTSNTISVTGHWRILSNVYSYALTAEPVAIGSSKDGTVRNDLRMTEENYQTYDNYIKIYIK